MSNIIAGDPAPTNPNRLVLSTGQEYADAICEIAVLARGEDPDRLIALVGAALRYVDANARAEALAADSACHRIEVLTEVADLLRDAEETGAALLVDRLLEGGDER
ncbi:hypothetical protein [Streptomyces sp. NBC_00207]|uniref:hypothetical protein n=1 Tax=Streptomyces sp. NBC_00207 TaxID=2903635 RepID=UPI003245F57B